MKIGIFQLTSALDYKQNLEKISACLVEANAQSVEALFLPECFYSMSDGSEPTPFLIHDDNEHYKNIQTLAKESGIYLLGGSAATSKNKSIVNRAYNFDPSGKDLGFYDKRHLFSCDITKDGVQKKINEGDIYSPGAQSKIIEAGPLKIGLGICVDLRFSELAHDYRMKGANLLTFSSAFTVPTGKAHWHTLLRARAIENQLFVVAPAQYGRHNAKISTYGHSLIIDPWGEVLADAGEGEKLITAEIDLTQLDRVRSSVIMNR
ncbi:MAG: carbon-nitrogen hydrolase family protein [Halobacteriovoraceae bacterium]|jgi:deaminated glutathione amidase|nr:carbon-nitrogen hydrolase family protein [Halobacteriovoraceae bacterium]MBT5092857.1 carbon-nitrogen hydrolase family protein [Halobacteriovoraceae bacterium]